MTRSRLDPAATVRYCPNAVAADRGGAGRGGAAAALDRPAAPVLDVMRSCFTATIPATRLHIVSKGRFALQIMTPLGDTATIGIRGPGDSFGELALVANRAAALGHGPGARGRGDVRCLPQRVRPSPQGTPERRRRPVRLLAGELRRQNELLLEALYVPVERRLLRRLLRARRCLRAPTASSTSPRSSSPR